MNRCVSFELAVSLCVLSCSPLWFLAAWLMRVTWTVLMRSRNSASSTATRTPAAMPSPWEHCVSFVAPASWRWTFTSLRSAAWRTGRRPWWRTSRCQVRLRLQWVCPCDTWCLCSRLTMWPLTPTAFWSLLWFVGFCFLANQWQVSKEEDNPLQEGVTAARAAIVFSFFSVFTWVRTWTSPEHLTQCYYNVTI